jgi:hypothetical protein
MARDESLAGPDHNLSEIITLADLGLGLGGSILLSEIIFYQLTIINLKNLVD